MVIGHNFEFASFTRNNTCIQNEDFCTDKDVSVCAKVMIFNPKLPMLLLTVPRQNSMSRASVVLFYLINCYLIY